MVRDRQTDRQTNRQTRKIDKLIYPGDVNSVCKNRKFEKELKGSWIIVIDTLC